MVTLAKTKTLSTGTVEDMSTEVLVERWDADSRTAIGAVGVRYEVFATSAELARAELLYRDKAERFFAKR